MKNAKYITVFILGLTGIISQVSAQCALCTKTAQQLGEGPASGLNKGIIYLMGIPLCILGIIGYQWYKREKVNNQNEAA